MNIFEHANHRGANYSYEDYVNNRAFVEGFKDYKKDLPPQFDNLFARKIGNQWFYDRKTYETGRQFAACFPEVKKLHFYGKICDNVIPLLKKAVAEGWILR